MFNNKHPHRFRSNAVSKHNPEKLLINNPLITDPNCVLSTWAEHFESPSKSQITSSVPLTEIQKRVQDMEHCSFNERDIILDVPFNVEEVEHALKCLKLKRYGGPDNFYHSTLDTVDQFVRTGFARCTIVSICDLELIPDCFKHRIIVPLLVNSYRGLTVTSVFAKVL